MATRWVPTGIRRKPGGALYIAATSEKKAPRPFRSPFRRSLLQLGTDLFEDPLFVGELAGCELGVDQLTVDGQLETSTP